MARSYEEAEQRIGVALRTQDQYLDLSNLQLERVPPEIGQLTELHGLHLDGNQLTALPSEIGHLTRLQVLDLDGNLLTALPLEIGQLVQLRKLDLNGNRLTALPLEIGRLTQLQWLHLDGNQLSSLPPAIGQLTQLRKLELNGNVLKALPSEIGQLTQLRKLDLGKNQLTEVPARIGQLAQLQELDLRANQLATLPAEIGRLTQLQVLNLEGNQLTALPAEIGRLTQLQALNLEGNQLVALPAKIGRLSKMPALQLSRNRLTSLPPEIGQLTQLHALELEGNQLRALPAEIGQLTQLQVLSLNGNQLTALPLEIGRLTQLRKLDLGGNQLTALPSEIGQLTQLPYVRDRSAAHRCLSALGLNGSSVGDAHGDDAAALFDLLGQGASSRFDVIVAMFRMVDVPDSTISWMIKHGVLHKPVAATLRETQLKFAGELMRHADPSKMTVDLFDLAAASTAAVELLVAIERACVPWGLEVQHPTVSVKPGSIGFTFEQALVAQITTFMAHVAESMDAASLTAVPCVLAMAPQFLDRWQKYRLRQIESEHQSADQPHVHEEPERTSDGLSAPRAAPPMPLGIGSMSVAGRIPEHIVKRAADLSKLPLDFANHLANRLLGPVGALYRRGIQIRADVGA